MQRGVEWNFEPTLDRISALMDVLGSPQHAYPVVHVAGTNGKSSTTRMIETILRERNLRVGRFTSPHLISMRERICIDGVPLEEERFAEVYQDVAPYLEMIDAQGRRLSFFETLTAMAFAAFADAPVDVAVIETGMGGSFDATNVADGTVAVITPVSLDHVDYLGPDVATIAGEKAGIIKPGATAVLAQQELPAAEVLMRRAAETGAVVAREGLEFGVVSRELAIGGQLLHLRGLKGDYEEVLLPLYGAHQAGNAACALAAVEALTAGDETLDPELVRQAFLQVRSPGRLEVVRRGPTVLVDAAHNPGGVQATLEAVHESFDFARLIAVVAVFEDKDVRGMLELLEPMVDEIVVTRNSSPRSMDVDELAALTGDVFGPERVRRAERLDDAIDLGIGLADEAGEFAGAGVLITGSVVTAGDARLLLKAGEAG
ncbi:bifunctional folylpolyglutamate synthase/dihydrofolate synthase [Planomonospora parontospora]|uniref:bifunctional folylpolyglutamate synthase/dihydrofolate synthase n=1 Tax=Planomonospora parontospora TaxID=58119 RepID=UPI0016716818|nr:folylpolyglutamate synthase/dihydrofolate synthase family protein [Planomonospora parontospora]GGL17730.1 dihydrofolate synthase [Planomonospora parontospora subsp. antibiotica]GII15648.1 dihydrofolate synthase [Planomonospora parontospora subsp. antibiotica]